MLLGVRTKYFPSCSELLNNRQRFGEGHTGIVHQDIQRSSIRQKHLHAGTDRGKISQFHVEELKFSFPSLEERMSFLPVAPFFMSRTCMKM